MRFTKCGEVFRAQFYRRMALYSLLVAVVVLLVWILWFAAGPGCSLALRSRLLGVGDPRCAQISHPEGSS